MIGDLVPILDPDAMDQHPSKMLCTLPTCQGCLYSVKSCVLSVRDAVVAGVFVFSLFRSFSNKTVVIDLRGSVTDWARLGKGFSPP